MADDLHGISDLIGDAFDLAPIEVTDLLKASPFISLLPMVPSSNGTTHKYTKETGAPVVGFRDANTGRDMDSSDDTLVTVNLKALDFTFQVDVIVADGWRLGTQHYLGREASRHLASAVRHFERQVINGIVGASDSAAPTNGDAGGFAGFRDAATVNALADTMVVNAAGSTADTQSSVWAVRIAEDGVCGVYKGDGDWAKMNDTVIVPKIVNPGTDQKTFPTYYTPGTAWLGLQVGSAYDIGRIANLDATHPLTDDMIADLISRFPVGFGPTHILMGRRSLKQLQDSRTATTTDGAPAPFPVDAFRIPIIVTDAIGAVEEVLA